MRKIAAHLVLTREGLLPGRVVVVDDGGKIVDLYSPEHLDREAGVEFFSGVLVPGFFNAHCHLELSGLRGAIPAGGGFAAFARGMRAARAAGGGAAGGEAAKWDRRMWEAGVSAVSDVCNSADTFTLKAQSPIRYHNFCELFGLGADPERVFALCGEARAAGLSASVTPHSTYSLNTSAFQSTASPLPAPPSGGRTADRGAIREALSIHFLESDQEVDLFRRKGPLWDWYASQGLAPDFLGYGGAAERLVAQVPPDRPVMLVHNCLASQRDIDIVMGHFTAPVTWVVCPASNRYIGGEEARPPVELLRKNGLRIAVGTDSLASNETLDMVGELALLHAQNRGVPLAEWLSWVAADEIAVGRKPGLVLLSNVDFQEMKLTEVTKSQRIL